MYINVCITYMYCYKFYKVLKAFVQQSMPLPMRIWRLFHIYRYVSSHPGLENEGIKRFVKIDFKNPPIIRNSIKMLFQNQVVGES